MAPHEPAVHGRAALAAWVRADATHHAVSAAYTSSDISVQGDLAVERYSARLLLTLGGAPIQETIKGIHVYRRQADGSWRIAVDIWNRDAPPPPR